MAGQVFFSVTMSLDGFIAPESLLAQGPPGEISVEETAGRSGPRFRLGFRSAVANVGRGPLIVEGFRDHPTHGCELTSATRA
jgi:hypothetical protein